jgi:hypothetical protein
LQLNSVVFRQSVVLADCWINLILNGGFVGDEPRCSAFQSGSWAALIAKQVQEFNSGSGNGAADFQIGRALNGHITVKKRTIFGLNLYNFEDRIGSANSAISFYKSQLATYRRALDTWSLVGIRCGVAKDIRILIGKLVGRLVIWRCLGFRNILINVFAFDDR